MDKIGDGRKVKLFCGIISADAVIEQKALAMLKEKFGEIDLISEVMPFDYSAYYNEEMGSGLKRFWISFKDLIFTGELADIKVWTYSVEVGFMVDGKRQINIDPGFISQANVILASTKDFSHRIYLSKGIYAEVTTIYSSKSGFVKLPWSYPDYMSETAKNFLMKARALLSALLLPL
jgi:hypothetical protein